MDRVIKFRAWFDDGKGYSNMLFVGDDYGTTHNLDCCKYKMEKQPIQLMQFIGLTDKNGVDIYEGDVVKISGSGLCITEIQPYCGVVYKCINKNMFDTDAHDVAAEREDIFVVGNIHENPELLEANTNG